MDRRGEPEYTLEEPSDGGSTSDESNVVADRHADLRNSFDELSDEETNFDRKMEEARRSAKSKAASDGWRSKQQYRQSGRPPPSWTPDSVDPFRDVIFCNVLKAPDAFPNLRPCDEYSEYPANPGRKPINEVDLNSMFDLQISFGADAGSGQAELTSSLGWEMCGKIAAEAGARMLEACSDLLDNLDNLDNLDDELLASCSNTAEAENRKLEMCSELLFDKVFDEDDVEALRPAMLQCWDLPFDESVKCMESVVTSSFRAR